MDVWVVAAAAGAGHVVQHIKNFARGKNNHLDLSSDNLNIVRPESSSSQKKVEDKNCSLRRAFSGKSFGEEMSCVREKAHEAACNSEIASTSGHEDGNLVMEDNFVSCNILSNSNSLSAILKNEDIRGESEYRLSSDSNEAVVGDSLPHPSTSETSFCYCNERRIRSSLKSGRIKIRSIKPQTSLESCLMAQLYEEDAEIEEFTYSPLQALQNPTVRPILVTDGSRIIRTAPYEYFSEATGNGTGEFQGAYSHENKTISGVPRLPNLVESGKRVKIRNRKDQVFRRMDSIKTAYGNHDNVQVETSDRALLFYLGLSMGIISTFLENKQEVKKLKNLLKQAENLVQDLQEELEMKYSFTVKELAAEDYESQNVHNNDCFDDAVQALSFELNLNLEYCDQKAEEKSLSKIEAELEAELERLESNMNSSSLEGKLCNLTKVYADRDGSRSSPPRSVLYPVSPKELSLRLHQVIQSRLEERVKELEMALENSQRMVNYMESEHKHPWREPSNHKTGTSSSQDSPISGDGKESIDQHVIINLPGEALTVYTEAYEEFSKVSESDEEDWQFGIENGYHVQNGYVDQQSASNGNQETVFGGRTEENHYSLSNDIVCSSRDETEDYDDEMERLLIRQIVEKAKQGSPAVLKAQRAFLFS